MPFARLLVLSLGVLFAAPAAPAAPADPLGSPRWGDMVASLLSDREVRFDARIRVIAPAVAEDPLNVPVTIDASGLPGVRRVVVFADFNPIAEVLAFTPLATRAVLGFRMKLQQSSPVRAAALTDAGVWHVGGTWVETSGGGCTLPRSDKGGDEWTRRLNRVDGRQWPRPDGDTRVRFKLWHPMDTGLAPGIPAFFVQSLLIRDERQVLMEIETHEPVAQDPVFTLDLPGAAARTGILVVEGRDNNGNRVDARIGR